MNSSFSHFKTQLHKPLSKFEFEFIYKTFGTAALYFFGFGFLVGCGCFVMPRMPIAIQNQSGLLLLISLLSIFGLMHFYGKYSRDPVNATQQTVNWSFGLLITSYLFIFVVLFSEWSSQLHEQIAGIATIFGASFMIYLIPAGIGLCLKSHKKAISLLKVLSFCYIGYMILFVIGLITYFASGFSSFGTGFTYQCMLLLLSVIVLISPIITFYKIRKIVPFIDSTNLYDVSKWKTFFAFEIVFQLIQIAMHILRLLYAGSKRG